MSAERNHRFCEIGGATLDLIDALKDDAQRMEDIATEAGFRIKGYAVRGKTPSQVQWAMANAILHLLQAEIRRGERNRLQ